MSRKIGIFGVPCDLFGLPNSASLAPYKLRNELDIMSQLRNDDIDVVDYGNVFLTGAENIIESFYKVNYLVSNMSNKIIYDGCVPVLIGGDHAVVRGNIEASAKHHENLGILWLDAHADANNRKTSPSGRIHGMVLGNIIGMQRTNLCGWYTGRGHDRLPPIVKREHAVVIGARAIDPDEEREVNNFGLRVFNNHYLEVFGPRETTMDALKYLVSNGVNCLHISVDMDILNPELYPGVSTPASFGPVLTELSEILQVAKRLLPVVSIDIVEYSPSQDTPNCATGNACISVIKSLSGSYTF